MKYLYHASPVGGIEILEPRISNHGDPRVYFSEKRGNTLVYLSNAVERFCKETEFSHKGIWSKWGPYGFTADRRFQFHEYYPDALVDTYKGVPGYIYTVALGDSVCPLDGIPGAYYSSFPVKVVACESIDDAYAEFMNAYHEKLIDIVFYENWSEKQLEGIRTMIDREYGNPDIPEDYRYFLGNKFPWLKDDADEVYGPFETVDELMKALKD